MKFDAKLLQRIEANDETLTAINLNDEEIGDIGAKTLAELLEKNTTVTEVRLSGNHISDIGIQALAAALIKNTAIRVVYLSANWISNAGAQALGAALAKSNTLNACYLSNNAIGNIGAQALMEAMEKNNSLTEIGLWNNRMDIGFQEKIEQKVKSNRMKAQQLIMVVRKGNLAEVKKLLAEGVALNYQDNEGNTALHVASELGYKEIVALLCSQPHQLILRNQQDHYPKGILAFLPKAHLVLPNIHAEQLPDNIFVHSGNLLSRAKLPKQEINPPNSPSASLVPANFPIPQKKVDVSNLVADKKYPHPEHLPKLLDALNHHFQLFSPNRKEHNKKAVSPKSHPEYKETYTL